MKGRLKRLIVLMMCFCMTAVYMPSFSFAEDGNTAPDTEAVTQDSGTTEDPVKEDQQKEKPQQDTDAKQDDAKQAEDPDAPKDAQDASKEPAAETDAPKDAQDTSKDAPKDAQDVSKEPAAAPVQNAVPAKNAALKAPKAGSSVSYKAKRVGEGSGQTTVFTVKDGGTTYTGACAEEGVSMSSSGTATTSKIANSTKIAKVVYYYGEVKGWWSGSDATDSAKNVLGLDYSTDITKRRLIECFCQIYNQGSSKWYNTVTGSSGWSKTTADAVRDYYADIDTSSITVPDGFEMYFCDAGSDSQSFIMWFFNPVVNGYVCLQKNAASTTTNFLNVAPNNYSLAGAVYWLFTDAACTVRAKDASGNNVVLTTTASGKTNAVEVEAGTYYAKEVTASKGFKLDTAVKPVAVTTSNTQSNPATVTSTEVPAYAYPVVKFEKNDKDGNLGWKKLIGAKYTLNYYDVAPGTTDLSGKEPKKTWTFTTKEMSHENGKKYAGIDLATDEPEEGNDSFWTVNGERVLPVGVFTIEEKQAPPGLAVDEKVKVGKIYQQSNGADALVAAVSNFEYTNGANTPVDTYDEEQAVILKLKKVDKETGESTAQGADREYSKGSLAGAEYEVYFDGPLQSDREKVGTITTDEKGEGELSKKENGDKLELGTYYIKEVKPSPGYTLDETEYTVIARAQQIISNTVEYSVTSKESPTEVLIHKTDITNSEELPGATLQVINSDDQIVEEWVSTEEPHEIKALPAGTYTLREITAPFGYDVAEDVEFTIEDDKVETSATMKNAPIDIKTTATDVTTGGHQGTFSAQEKIKDVVAYTNLYAGRTYTFKGTLMDKDTKEPLKGADGKEITAEREYTVPGEEGTLVSGEVELEFTVDASEFTKEKKVVAFEDLEREGRKLAIHADLEDKKQTIPYGGIVKTTAVDKESKTHNVLGKKDALIVDTVEYKNLSTEETYYIFGELFDKTTGQLTGAKASAKFTPKTENGTVDVEFKLNTSDLKNHTLVAFEELTIVSKKDGTETLVVIDEHKYPDDVDQTVYVPDIKTTATGVDTNDHIAMGDENVSIKDVVTYSNLIPGKTYTMNGTLMNKNTGEPLLVDGMEVTATQTFTPTQANGTVELIFTFDGVDLTGTKVVAFEECTVNKIPVAIHADINDAEQTVDIPKIGTKVGKVKGKTVVDTVKYKNLIPGKTYVMRGWLVNRSSRKRIADSEGETTFVPSSANGSVKVTLHLNNMKSDAVAFEECYLVTYENGIEKEVKVGEHKDIKDKAQLVRMTSKGPKTGDNYTALYGLAGIFAAALGTVLTRIRRRKAENLK